MVGFDDCDYRQSQWSHIREDVSATLDSELEPIRTPE
jgi:hypothetical protein